MRTAKDRTLDIMHEIVGKAAVTRELLSLMIDDPGDNGVTLRKMRDAIARGIEADRREAQKASAPS